MAKFIDIQQHPAFENDDRHRHLDDQTDAFLQNRGLYQAYEIRAEDQSRDQKRGCCGILILSANICAEVPMTITSTSVTIIAITADSFRIPVIKDSSIAYQARP